MIQFPICPPEVFAWWVAQWFCSYVFVQYSPLVFIGTQSYGYMHLNFQFCVCNSFGVILHESHIEMGIILSSKLLASEERCSEICITDTYHFFLLESRMTRGAYFGIWRLLVHRTSQTEKYTLKQECFPQSIKEYKCRPSSRVQITVGYNPHGRKYKWKGSQ